MTRTASYPFLLRRRLLGAALLAPLGAWQADARAAPSRLRVLAQELPPYATKIDSAPQGLIIDMFHELMHLQHVDHPIELAVLPRAIDVLEGRHPVAFGPLARTEIYEARFRWVGPIVTNPSVVWRKRSELPKPANLDELRSAQQIAVGRASTHEGLMNSHGFTNLFVTRDAVDAMRRVVAGQSDYVVTGLLTVNEGLDALGVDHSQLENTGITLAQLPICIAFSKAVSNQEFESWQAAFRTLKRKGLLYKLLQKYFGKAIADSQGLL